MKNITIYCLKCLDYVEMTYHKTLKDSSEIYKCKCGMSYKLEKQRINHKTIEDKFWNGLGGA